MRKKPGDEDERKTESQESDEDWVSHWATERKCPVCGKSFCVQNKELWVYKAGDIVMCSWHCLREREKRLADKARPKRNKSGLTRYTPEQLEKLEELVKAGKSNIEIGCELGVRADSVWYHKKKIQKKVQGC